MDQLHHQTGGARAGQPSHAIPRTQAERPDIWNVFALLLAAALLVLGFSPAARADSEVTVFSYPSISSAYGNANGSALLPDGKGNFFGSTQGPGSNEYGTVFELSPATGGGWNYNIVFSFSGGADGGDPYGTLIADKAGNLYGTTIYGGTGYGVVFELSLAPGGGYYTETVLHTFSYTDGSEPYAGLVADSNGNLFGTTQYGGTSNEGTVFELSPASGGGYTFTSLHSFSGADGWTPMSALIIDGNGNLFGTTQGGGNLKLDNGYGVGTVYELSPIASGGYQESVLYAFQGNNDGAFPHSSLILDKAGNLYGVAPYSSYDPSHGSGSGDGLVFELAANGGSYSQVVLHAFGGTDGAQPSGGLIFDSTGDLFGTTAYGGNVGAGAVYKLSPVSGGTFTESVLYSFTGGDDGASPITTLTEDGAGNVYGTAGQGGSGSAGTIYEIPGAIVITPPPPPPPPALAVTIGVNPSTVYIGETVTLSWSVANGTGATCTASGAWNGTKPETGSMAITKLAVGTFTYTLSCTGPNGSDSKSAVLTVKDQLPGISLHLLPNSVSAGSPAMLAWTVTHSVGATCVASGAWSGSKAIIGGTIVSQSVPGTYTYTLTCTNGSGSGVASALLTVH